MAHERISPMAWLVAYQRTFTDIPFSTEMFHELDQIIRQTRTAPEVDSMEVAEQLVLLAQEPLARKLVERAPLFVLSLRS